MARKVDIEYIRYYSIGSAARQLELKPHRRKSARPVRTPQSVQKTVIAFDPLIIMGTLCAVCMLIMMVAGAVKLGSVKKQEQQMESYLMLLQHQNVQLEGTYEETVDLEKIEKQALALGMVPKDQVTQIPIRVEIPAQTQPETGWWDGVVAFLTGLFA